MDLRFHNKNIVVDSGCLNSSIVSGAKQWVATESASVVRPQSVCFVEIAAREQGKSFPSPRVAVKRSQGEDTFGGTT